MARQTYSDDVKAACLAALLAGEAPAAVAARFAVTPATVRGWKSRLAGAGGAAGASAASRAQIGELVLDYLRQGLQALREQATVFGDGEWIRKQNAADIAILHGVLADKSIRLLEALEPPSDGGAARGSGDVPELAGAPAEHARPGV